MKRVCAVLILALSGCAQLPTDLPARPALREPATAATLASLTRGGGQAGAALDQRWWESFGLTDLNRLVETALKDAPDMESAQARLRGADQAEHLARLESQVRYETEASVVRERMSRNGLFPPPLGGSTFNQADITENLSYSLDWWGKNRALIQAAGNERQATRDEAAAVRLTLTAAVTDAYFAAAGVTARLAVAHTLQQSHRKEHDLLKARLELGFDSALPLIDARRKLDLDEDMIRALEYLQRSLRYRLSALIGSDPDHAAGLPTPMLAAHLPPLPDRLPLDWLAQRPDVAALRSRVEAAADLSDAARADFYPNLDLRLMVGLESLDLGKLLQAGSLGASVGPALYLPIFNTRTLRAKLGMREADYASTVAAYNQTILEAARQAADACALIASLEQRSRAQRLALQETEQTHTLAEQRQKLGLAGPLDALVADSAVLDQRMNDIETQATRLRARVALYKALGGNAPDKDLTP
ncbi:multidrug resistance outer membrane protein MdtP precursor [mine drainage metagenome]|uniref:Multidrug resistance outer membrane protein MdtP n=1 Tax=mine drainage metagenome TaxID=410659 RepID=A0A1J5QSZ6_9ZZZZ